MKIAYLLEDTELSGGIRVVAAQADALTDLGHEVTLITRGRPLDWRSSRAKWMYVGAYEEVGGSQFDFVVGTFWTTIGHALRLGGSRAVHLCQGYEGSFSWYQSIKEEIDAVYRLPVPKLTVSPRLVPICRAFYDDATYIGQIVDAEFYQPHPSRSNTPRVLLVGPAQAEIKGIDVGYEAVRRARDLGSTFDLVRVSQWAPAEGEPTDLAAEFHVAISSAEMVRLIASCEAYLGPNRAQEGFGLPAAEALAGGVPAVLSGTPSFLSWDETRDYALFAPDGDGAAMGDQLARLLGDRALQASLARRGREVVEQFRAETTGARLDAWFRSRAAGAGT